MLILLVQLTFLLQLAVAVAVLITAVAAAPEDYCSYLILE
jgi:hypothetical protein